jgi:phosphopantothenoylcysteine decarboxylase/phosphopantothenate--cysteine ligase
MNNLTNKRILLGVTGGIAAYKSAELLRRLRDHGAEVRVVMTRGACEFITPLTMQALSGREVHTELLDQAAESGMGHIALARWCDVVLVAPASANFIARLAQGMADDLLSTLCLATTAPVGNCASHESTNVVQSGDAGKYYDLGSTRNKHRRAR